MYLLPSLDDEIIVIEYKITCIHVHCILLLIYVKGFKHEFILKYCEVNLVEIIDIIMNMQ